MGHAQGATLNYSPFGLGYPEMGVLHRLPEFPGGVLLQVPTVVRGLIMHPSVAVFLPAPSLPHPTAGASWEHLPNKLLALEPFSLGLLQEPKLRHSQNIF